MTPAAGAATPPRPYQTPARRATSTRMLVRAVWAGNGA